MIDLATAVPFAAACGIELVEAAPEGVVAALDWAPERCTAGGVLHGGALMTLADTAGAVLAFLNLPPGASTATTDSATRLLRAVRSGRVTAHSRLLHRGRTALVVVTEVLDDSERLVAYTTQSQAVLPAP